MTTLYTHTGGRLDLMEPDPDAIHLVDIGRGLANTCRFAGQTHRHYSVAQHSLIVADAATLAGWTPEAQAAALLHDAAEAYIGDLIRPVRLLVRGFDAIETRLLVVIGRKFEVDLWRWLPLVKELDDWALRLELSHFFGADYDLAPPACLPNLADVEPVQLRFGALVATRREPGELFNAFWVRANQLQLDVPRRLRNWPT